MYSKVESQLLVKLFLGFQLDLPLKKEISKSLSWKQAMISWQSEEQDGLTIAPFHKKEFLGQYSTQEQLQLAEIKKIEKNMKQLIQTHCPRANLESYKLYLFAQVFIL